MWGRSVVSAAAAVADNSENRHDLSPYGVNSRMALVGLVARSGSRGVSDRGASAGARTALLGTGPRQRTDRSPSLGRISLLPRSVWSSRLRDVDMAQVIRERRAALGMSQAAAKAGVDKRQIRWYEAAARAPVRSSGVSLPFRSRAEIRTTLLGYWARHNLWPHLHGRDDPARARGAGPAWEAIQRHDASTPWGWSVWRVSRDDLEWINVSNYQQGWSLHVDASR
jgi:hypothetical protein